MDDPRLQDEGKAPHRVPLSSRAIEIVKARRKISGESLLVFPSRQDTPLSDMAMTQAPERCQSHSDTPGRVATAHGFRSAFRDWASESGYARDLAERALAHTIRNSTEAAYHRTDLLEQRRKMIEHWARHVCGAHPAAASE